MKKYIKWIVLAVIVLVLGYEIWNSNRPVSFGPGTQSVEDTVYTNDWVPVKAVDPNDTDKVIKATWSQSWGTAKVAYCRVAFRNDKERQYRLVAPWMVTIDIERTNVDDIKFEVVPMDSAIRGIIQKK